MNRFLSGSLWEWVIELERLGCWQRLKHANWKEIWKQGYPELQKIRLPSDDEKDLARTLSDLPVVVQDALAICVLQEWVDFERPKIYH